MTPVLPLQTALHCTAHGWRNSDRKSFCSDEDHHPYHHHHHYHQRLLLDLANAQTQNLPLLTSYFIDRRACRGWPSFRTRGASRVAVLHGGVGRSASTPGGRRVGPSGRSPRSGCGAEASPGTVARWCRYGECGCSTSVCCRCFVFAPILVLEPVNQLTFSSVCPRVVGCISTLFLAAAGFSCPSSSLAVVSLSSPPLATTLAFMYVHLPIRMARTRMYSQICHTQTRLPLSLFRVQECRVQTDNFSFPCRSLPSLSLSRQIRARAGAISPPTSPWVGAQPTPPMQPPAIHTRTLISWSGAPGTTSAPLRWSCPPPC